MRQLLLFLLFPFCVFSQKNTSYEVVEQTKESVIVKIKIGDIKRKEISSPRGLAQIISLDKATPILKEGAPDIPKLAFSLALPSNKNGRIELLDEKFIVLNQQKIAPSKGRVNSAYAKSNWPFSYGQEYNQDAYFPTSLGEANTPYVLRQVRGQAFHIYPIRYNPIQEQLRVSTELTLQIHFDQVDSFTLLTESERHFDQTFEEIYKYQFLNYKTLNAPYTPLSQVGSMLVLCPTKYMSAIPDWVKWKEQKGFKVFIETPDTMVAGISEATIRARVAQYYQQHQITYLLIVGDNADIPARNAYYTDPTLFGPSDAAYAYLVGTDHYPELIVGRISADTLKHVVTQVKKVLDYEKQANTSGAWMQTQIAMASSQGPGDKGEMDYEHLRGILDSNKNYYSYNLGYEFYDGGQGGIDAPGNPTAAMFTNAINGGAGLINYCGHGSVDIFTTSLFSGLNDVPNLNNINGQWPFILSTACLNGNFIYSTCLGESLLRATNASDQPTGAVASLMCSIFQAWDPPMQGQDEMNAILRGARQGTYQTTFGAITHSGFMSTMDHYNSNIDPHGGDEIADTWIVFGDPSLELYTKDKGSLTCSHTATIGLGSVNYSVQCAENNALIGLYYQDHFLASAVVQGGVASFTFPALNNMDSIFITATKQNFKPYYGFTEVINGQAFSINDLLKENIELYPNPAIDFIVLKDADHKIDQITVHDINGRVLIRTQDKKINISQLAAGQYQLKVQLKNNRIVGSSFSKY